MMTEVTSETFLISCNSFFERAGFLSRQRIVEQKIVARIMHASSMETTDLFCWKSNWISHIYIDCFRQNKLFISLKLSHIWLGWITSNDSLEAWTSRNVNNRNCVTHFPMINPSDSRETRSNFLFNCFDLCWSWTG